LENLISKNISFPFHIELIAFSDSEGSRFNCPYLGSRVIAGLFKNKYLKLKDNQGNTFSSVLNSLNYDIEKIKEDAINAENLLGYYEIQVEKESLLYEQKIPVGIINSMLGEKRIDIDFIGKSSAAGSTPMNERNDALCAAAKFILSVEKYAAGEKRKLRATVGKINVADSAANLVPGFVNCTLEIRSDEEELLSDAYEFIYSTCEKNCDKRNIYFEWKLIEETDPVVCNKKFKKLLSNSILQNNFPVVSVETGADEDAAVLGKITPVSILLVRSFKGNSRYPEENVEVNDIATALKISDHFITQLASPEKLLKKKEK
jgi:allantoate deiminase